MKDPKLTQRAGIPRDAENLPAFQSLADARAVFEDDEITLMINHYLRMDWSAEFRANKLRHAEAKRLYREQQAKLAPPPLPAAKFAGSQLKPKLPLRQQQLRKG